MRSIVGAIFAAVALSACAGSSTSKYPSNAARIAGPGNFGMVWVSAYANSDLGPNPLAAAGAIGAELTTNKNGGPWNETFSMQEQLAGPAAFTDHQGDTDAIFAIGHGNPGRFLFNQWPGGGSSAYWGPGPLVNGPQWGIGGNTAGMPVQGRLKWIFFLSSTTVTPNPGTSVVGSPSSPGYDGTYLGDWRYAFRSPGGQPGSLHGIYGTWMGPGTCTTTDPRFSKRVCDIIGSNVEGAAQPIGRYLWSNAQPLIVHDAWLHALADGGFTVGTAEFEDTANLRDTFTGAPGVNPAPQARSYNFTWVTGDTGTSKSAMGVSADTFTLAPRSLYPESISDAQQNARAQSYLGEPVYTAMDQHNVTMSYTDSGLVGNHYGAGSGAVILQGPVQHNPVVFDQTTALNAANDYISSTFGMPSDAVLSTTAAVMEYDDLGNSTKTGYIFTWRHSSNNVFGGDAMRIFVDDTQTPKLGACLGWEWTTPEPPMRPIKVCAEYDVTYVDQPNISYYYRLWRGLNTSGTRQVLSGGRSTGQQSIDALTASYSLPSGSVVTGYTSGYWTAGSASTDATSAQSAWIFNLGDDSVAGVDAFTGELLGVQTL